MDRVEKLGFTIAAGFAGVSFTLLTIFVETSALAPDHGIAAMFPLIAGFIAFMLNRGGTSADSPDVATDSATDGGQEVDR